MQFFTETVSGVLEQQAEAHPNHEFEVYPDRDLRFTYAEFNERVNRLAKGMLAIGIGPGDHVGIWSRNVPDWLTFFFATARIGAVIVTINPANKRHELAYIMRQADLKAIAIIDEFRDIDYISTLYELVPELKHHERGRLRSNEFPKLNHVIYIGQRKHRGMFSSTELLNLGEHCAEAELLAAKISMNSDDVVNMQYTSGTTGFPKGVMLTHRNILNNGFYIGERQKFTDRDRVCLPVPLFHCFGIVLGVMAAYTHGATLVMLEQFDPLLALAAVQKEKCTALYGVPTMFIAELAHPMFKMFDLTSLRTGIMAGSPCPIETMRRVINEMHCSEITIAYGLTEASPVITQTSTDETIERRVGTVGTVLPDTEVKIIDPETSETLGGNTPGELCCRGYNVMKGYYNMPEATALAIDPDGWLHSGDLATRDEHGYYRITGRIKDMIIRGGENIYPREIEELLYTMPGIKDVQVVGVPDQRFGEVVGAFIILHDGVDVTEEDVLDFCQTRIARFKVPRYVFFVKEFPSTTNGKIQKFKLQALAKEKLHITGTIFEAENAG
ncbi:MAG TPA: AMP-binding protein [Candidatus Hydrogenedentes bacterium]|nr:AMP-binding protein [Candidatus Hydrogenedentota bacterium]